MLTQSWRWMPENDNAASMCFKLGFCRIGSSIEIASKLRSQAMGLACTLWQVSSPTEYVQQPNKIFQADRFPTSVFKSHFCAASQRVCGRDQPTNPFQCCKNAREDRIQACKLRLCIKYCHKVCAAAISRSTSSSEL